MTARKNDKGSNTGTKNSKTAPPVPNARSVDAMGEILLREQVVSIEQLDQARGEIAKQGGTLQRALSGLGHLSETDYVKQIAKRFGVASVDIDQIAIPEDVLKVFSKRDAVRFGIVPIEIQKDTLSIVTADPAASLYLMDDFKHMTGFKKVEVLVTTESQLESALNEFYKEDTLTDVLENSDMSTEDIRILREEDTIDMQQLESESGEEKVVRFVNLILYDAIMKGASDIHIESYEKSYRVRYRIDGVLSEAVAPESRIRNAVVSRIKIMSDLDISERRLPQDGRIKLKIGDTKDVDFRVSVLPTTNGEHIVLRILDKSALKLDMTKLGFNAGQFEEFQQAVKQPWGMVLVTGPTGSGKTTTLYSALMELNKSTDKILTAEDPVEITVEGISQVHINDEIGLNFAAALRSFLRQDPDIIMVGEIRDFETAEIAIKAALTGHLVLSTLHTNDAPSTINRLLNMGVEPFLVTSAINLIAAQRLVRVICKACKEPLPVSADRLLELGLPEDKITDACLYHGVGCKRCNNTGYKGRIGLYELMSMGDKIRECVLQGYSAMEIRREATRLGMQPLRESGIDKMLEGVTTLEEILRVTRK